jgi:hypothetical protein
MTRFLAKLAFLHRRLWRQDGTYRWAALLGPPPLFGVGLAAALWAGLHAYGVVDPPPPWAPSHQAAAIAPSRAPRVEPPERPLPAPGAFVPGWEGAIHAMTIAATLDADVAPAPLSGARLDRTGVGTASIDMASILAAGPRSGLYAGIGTAMLAVKTAGVYAVSLRLERDSPEPANCLTRLFFARYRLVSNLILGITGHAVRDYDPDQFVLQPGLYPIAVGFACWRGDRMVGPGAVTVLIRRPGEAALAPLRADEIMHARGGN